MMTEGRSGVEWNVNDNYEGLNFSAGEALSKV